MQDTDTKKFSTIQLFEGLTVVSKFEDLLTDPTKGPRLAAIAIADDESIKKSRKDQTFLNAFIQRVELMEPEEVAEVIRNFSEKVKDFSTRMTPVAHKK